MEVRKRRIAKNKRKVVFRLLLILMILLLIGTGIISVILLLRNNLHNVASFGDVSFAPGQQYSYTGSGFLYIQDSKLNYEDINNSKKDYEVTMNGPDVQLTGSSSIHILYNSSFIKIVDVEYPVEFTGSLVSVKCGNGYFAALRKDLTGKESIQVFNKQGIAQDQLEYSGQFIVDYGFYQSNSEYLYVITLSIDSSTPQSTISVYDMTAKTTSGVMHVQNQLIEQMRFAPQGIFVVGTNQIIRYSLTGNRETFREMIYGWQVFDYEAGINSAFLLKPRGSGMLNTIKLIQLKDSDTPGATQRYLQMPSGTIDAFLLNGKLVALTQNGYTVYSLDGKVQSNKNFSTAIDLAKKLDASNLLLQSGNSYHLLKIT